MATIKPYQDKKGNTLYYCRVYLGTDDRGKQVNKFKRGFKTTKEANLWASRLIVEVDKKGLPSASDTSLSLSLSTFGELARHWLDLHKTRVKPSTIYQINMELKNAIFPIFENIPIKNITPLLIQSAYLEWSKRYKCIRRYSSLLKRILEYAVLLDIINVNPCNKAITPKKQREIDDTLHFWSVAEVNKFLEHAKNDLNPLAFPLFRLLIFTGLRKGEALALRWCDIDFNNLTLSVRQNIGRDENGSSSITTPKTKRSQGTLPIDKVTMQILKDWKVEQSKRFQLLGASAFVDSKALIFRLKAEDKPLGVTHVNIILKRIALNANVPVIRVHDLRHTQATLLLESGANIKDVQERLRHENIQTTLQIYSHVSEERKRETIENLVNYLNA